MLIASNKNLIAQIPIHKIFKSLAKNNLHLIDYTFSYNSKQAITLHKTLPITIQSNYLVDKQWLSLEESNINGHKKIWIFAIPNSNNANIYGIITQLKNPILYESKVEFWQYKHKNWQQITNAIFKDYPIKSNILLDNCSFSVQNMNTKLLPMFYYFNPESKELFYSIDWDTITALCLQNKEEQFLPSEYIPSICLLKNCIQEEKKTYILKESSHIFELISK